VTLTEPTPITSTVTTTDANCGASDGSATVNASGGTAGYTYAWAPVGGTNATASGIPAGAYTCTITDANGCTSTANANINNLNGPTATLVSSSDALCFGGNTGVAVADASGGTGPYNFAWSPIGGTNDTATALPSGSYTCTVTDANGCLNSVTVNITEPAQLSISATSTPASCSNNNGTATGTPTGGTNTYTYSWSSGGTSAVETNLAAGNYTLTITDSNGCSASQTVTVTQTQAITSTASSTGAACFGGLTGTATVSPATGTPPYTYSWSSGGTNATESGLAAGTYTCTITDSTGCTGTQTVTITEPTQLTATSTNGNISCFGSSDGTATITGSGGTPTYTYSWAPSGGTNATANNLGVGTYTCTMTDANGCTTTQSVTITQPTQISSTATVTPVLCNGGTTGTASVTASGGTGAYTYSWAPSGGTNANATGLGAGTYTCTITDANGCTFTQTSTVTQPNALTVSTGNGDACAGLPISISSTVTGGTGPYTYSWSNAVTTASQTVNVVQTTTFTVTVTDANGCVTTANATATVDPAPVAAFTSNAVNGFFDLGSGNLDLCFTDQSTGASVWLWDLDGTGSVSQSPCITLTAADSGQFCAVQYVTNSSGCADTAEICIQVGESYFNVPNVFTPNADNSNDVFYITNSGMQKLHCEIYDRWGILMYKWDDTAGYWDGRTQSGGLATDGVYYYAATLTDFSGKEIVLKGFVHLLRGK
jgi:gliding motility-associated-like protein